MLQRKINTLRRDIQTFELAERYAAQRVGLPSCKMALALLQLTDPDRRKPVVE